MVQTPLWHLNTINSTCSGFVLRLLDPTNHHQLEEFLWASNITAIRPVVLFARNMLMQQMKWVWKKVIKKE
jgi:ABC-type enterochelin transport system permease subunit